MDEHTSHEQAYKNGYDKGYADGKRDAEEQIRILKQKRVNLFERIESYERGRSAGIKAFAEKLKSRKYMSSDWSHGEHPFVVEEDDIDEIVEEMVGAEDGT